MTWTRLDENLLEHPKILKAGSSACWLFVAGLVYANRYGTNGFIPRKAVPRLTDCRRSKQLAERLVEVGLWHEDSAGYCIHDFEDYQPRKERGNPTPDLSRVRSQAGRLGAQRKAEQRQSYASASGSEAENSASKSAAKVLRTKHNYGNLRDSDSAISKHITEHSSDTEIFDSLEEYANRSSKTLAKRSQKSWQNRQQNSGKNSHSDPVLRDPPLPPKGHPAKTDSEPVTEASPRTEPASPTGSPSPDVEPPPSPAAGSPPPVTTTPLTATASPVTAATTSPVAEPSAATEPPTGHLADPSAGPVLAQNGPFPGLSGPDCGIAPSDSKTPSLDPATAPQSACGKVRDKSTRRFESSFVAAEYSQAIVAVTGGKYVVPRDQLAILDDALDHHGPSVRELGSRLRWLGHAAREFARQVLDDEEQAIKYRSGYDPKGFLRWCNDGGVRRLRTQTRKTPAEKPGTKTPAPPLPDALLEEIQSAETLVSHLREHPNDSLFGAVNLDEAEARLRTLHDALARRNASLSAEAS